MRFWGSRASGEAVTRQNDQTRTRDKQKKESHQKRKQKRKKKRSIPYQLKNIYPGNKKKL